MTATCDACQAINVPVHRDRRIPRRWGGTYDPPNCHDLCATCHGRKTVLETRITTSGGGCTDAEHAEWFALAFPPPVPIEAMVYVTTWEGGDPRRYLYARLLVALKSKCITSLEQLDALREYGTGVLAAAAATRPFKGTHVYEGVQQTRGELINLRCDQVAFADGTLVAGGGKQLVVDRDGRRYVVVASALRRSSPDYTGTPRRQFTSHSIRTIE